MSGARFEEIINRFGIKNNKNSNTENEDIGIKLRQFVYQIRTV